MYIFDDSVMPRYFAVFTDSLLCRFNIYSCLMGECDLMTLKAVNFSVWNCILHVCSQVASLFISDCMLQSSRCFTGLYNMQSSAKIRVLEFIADGKSLIKNQE